MWSHYSKVRLSTLNNKQGADYKQVYIKGLRDIKVYKSKKSRLPMKDNFDKFLAEDIL